MIVKLFDMQGKRLHEQNLHNPVRRPDCLIWRGDVYVADPFTVSRQDSWWRYSLAFCMTLTEDQRAIWAEKHRGHRWTRIGYCEDCDNA